MHKKILALCAALVALAVTPAMASASPVLQEGGVNVAVGSSITATATTVQFTSNLGTVTCAKSVLHGKVSANTGKLVEGNVEKATFTNNEGGACESWAGAVTVTTENLPWCVQTTSTTADTFKIRGGGCGAAEKNLQFTLDFPGFSCKFSKAGGVTGTYKTGTGTLDSTSAVFSLIEGGFFCPSSGTLDPETYHLETSNGTALAIN
jgi:hypothetical protein